MKILFVLTFVYGVLNLITKTKLFDYNLSGLLNSFFGRNEKRPQFIRNLIIVLDTWFFYFSLCYQVWFWAHRLAIL